MSNWFHKFGELVRGPFTSTKWLFYEFTGTENEAALAEAEAGRSIARKLHRDYPVFENRSYQQYLDDMGQYLQRFLPPNEYCFTYHPVSSHSINAFAVPGGRVFVTRGLLEFTQWERDEIAFAVAHEIGHVICHHARERLIANTLKKGTAFFVRAFRVPKALSSLANAYVFSEYSHDCEFEADEFAARLLLRARMNPMAGATFLSRLDSISSSHDTSVTARFFSSHPPVAERVRRIRRAVS